MLQKTKVKKIINQQGFKMSAESFDFLERYAQEIIIKLLSNVEADGMKTLMPDHIPFGQEDKKKQVSCKRCIKLEDQTLQWGEAVQDKCITMARQFAKRL